MKSERSLWPKGSASWQGSDTQRERSQPATKSGAPAETWSESLQRGWDARQPAAGPAANNRHARVTAAAALGGHTARVQAITTRSHRSSGLRGTRSHPWQCFPFQENPDCLPAPRRAGPAAMRVRQRRSAVQARPEDLQRCQDAITSAKRLQGSRDRCRPHMRIRGVGVLRRAPRAG